MITRIPHYTMVTPGTPAFAYAVRRGRRPGMAGSDLLPQFSGNSAMIATTPEEKARILAQQQANLNATAAAYAAVGQSGVTAEDAAMIAELTAAEVEQDAKRRRKRSMTLLGLGIAAALVAFTAGDDNGGN